MFDRLKARADLHADAAKQAIIRRIAGQPTPPGVTATATGDGVILSGRNLRRRMINDTNLRNFGR
jgi:hypothetical protein